MKIKPKDFRVPAGKQVDLKKWPTRVDPVYKSKKQYHKLLVEQVEELSRCSVCTMRPTVTPCY